MMDEEYRQSIVDEEQLRLLPVFYWVSGSFTALVSLYFLIYAALGIAIALAPASSSSGNPPTEVGWVFLSIGLGGFLIVAAVATLRILTGFWIRKRKHPVMCMVAAGLSCIEIPYGTLLGVWTFIVLLRPSVAVLFGAKRGASEPPVPPAPPALASGADAG